MPLSRYCAHSATSTCQLVEGRGRVPAAPVVSVGCGGGGYRGGLPWSPWEVIPRFGVAGWPGNPLRALAGGESDPSPLRTLVVVAALSARRLASGSAVRWAFAVGFSAGGGYLPAEDSSGAPDRAVPASGALAPWLTPAPDGWLSLVVPGQLRRSGRVVALPGTLAAVPRVLACAPSESAPLRAALSRNSLLR